MVNVGVRVKVKKSFALDLTVKNKRKCTVGLDHRLLQLSYNKLSSRLGGHGYSLTIPASPLFEWGLRPHTPIVLKPSK